MYPLSLLYLATSLPLRSRLVKKDTEPSRFHPNWYMSCLWTAGTEEPFIGDISLKSVKLKGFDCLVLHCVGFTREELSEGVEDRRSLVLLMSPCDADVWAAIDAWIGCNMFEVRCAPTWAAGGCTPLERYKDVLRLRDAAGDEGHSCMLGRAIQELALEGRLETELAVQLGTKLPIYLSVMETPMMMKSLEPKNPRMVQAYEEEWEKMPKFEGNWN